MSLLDELLQRGVDEGGFPAAQACVVRRGVTIYEGAAGSIGGGSLVTADTRFDVASLTKAISTTTAAYVLLTRGALRLSDEVRRWFPGFTPGVTVRQLLAHTSGLPAWRPLFRASYDDPACAALWPGGGDAELFARSRELVIDAAAGAPMELEPGLACVYSDLGFILLGEILARCAGSSLDRFFDREIAAPLGLAATSYRPLPVPPAAGIAPTGLIRPREPAQGQEGLYEIPPQPETPRPGEVDDDNCWAMGGVSGHAGLFSTARDVAAWGAAMVRERAGARRLGDPAVLAEMMAPDPHPQGPPRALGFDLPSGPRSSIGTRLGTGEHGAVGHLAFTGCSVWIDLDRELVVALLTNRVYPSRSNEAGIRIFRPAFHDAVAASFDAP